MQGIGQTLCAILENLTPWSFQHYLEGVLLIREDESDKLMVARKASLVRPWSQVRPPVGGIAWAAPEHFN